jgi:hypothetical protein
MKSVAGGPVHSRDLAMVMGWPDQYDRARRVAQSLVADGLLVVEHDRYRHP